MSVVLKSTSASSGEMRCSVGQVLRRAAAYAAVCVESAY